MRAVAEIHAALVCLVVRRSVAAGAWIDHGRRPQGLGAVRCKQAEGLSQGWHPVPRLLLPRERHAGGISMSLLVGSQSIHEVWLTLTGRDSGAGG